jgi:hypothetical protein
LVIVLKTDGIVSLLKGGVYSKRVVGLPRRHAAVAPLCGKSAFAGALWLGEFGKSGFTYLTKLQADFPPDRHTQTGDRRETKQSLLRSSRQR